MGKKAKVPKPKPITQASMAKEISNYVGGYGAALPSVLALEQQYRPQFGAQNLADIGQYQMGLQALQGQATQTAQQQLQEAQAASIGGMTGLAGGARGLMQAISPEGAGLVGQSMQASQAAQQYATQFGQESKQAYQQYAPDLSRLDTSGITNLAQKAFQSAETLSPEQIRNAQQTAREAGMMSGRVGGTSTVASEILNREAAKSQRRSEAAQLGSMAFQQQGSAMEQQRAAQAQGFGQFSSLGQQNLQAQEAARMANQQAFGQQQSFYTQPIFGLLGSTPQSYSAGQQYTKYGMGMLGSSTPGLINPDVGLNLAAAGRRDELAAQSAQAQARATEKAGMMSMFGNILSDINAKTEIKKIGVTDGGLPVYTYRYKTGGPVHMGVMAQEAEVNHPDSVIEVDGFKMVDYSKIK